MAVDRAGRSGRAGGGAGRADDREETALSLAAVLHPYPRGPSVPIRKSNLASPVLPSRDYDYGVTLSCSHHQQLIGTRRNSKKRSRASQETTAATSRGAEAGDQGEEEELSDKGSDKRQ
ncbi:hypothetical protein THAOC_25327 [Thalassiosira oceanica]|uniref:Uncharacterized protein n=1 Tax=Thalassiosira oceanica TaxID=159749 RepID=K0S1Q6_THAOC|nr:hypothetical protein THAOC_25327 [Thalassiosira oceanica]|eukprot:EJK54991.1 hypothetical protein THAOC_25327 [Thalassiosira oceanica]